MPQHASMRPSGLIIVDDPERGVTEVDTLQCCHCGGHFPVQPGSGKRRGFCIRCMGPLCGAEACGVCVPAEKRLEQIEQAAEAERRILLG